MVLVVASSTLCGEVSLQHSGTDTTGYQQLRSSLMGLLLETPTQPDNEARLGRALGEVPPTVSRPPHSKLRMHAAWRLLVLGSGDSALSAELVSDKALQHHRSCGICREMPAAGLPEALAGLELWRSFCKISRHAQVTSIDLCRGDRHSSQAMNSSSAFIFSGTLTASRQE